MTCCVVGAIVFGLVLRAIAFLRGTGGSSSREWARPTREVSVAPVGPPVLQTRSLEGFTPTAAVGHDSGASTLTGVTISGALG